jgi:hypothetical protein
MSSVILEELAGLILLYILEYIGNNPGDMPHGLAKHTTQSYKRVTLAQKYTIADGLKHDLKPSIIKKKLQKLDPKNLVDLKVVKRYTPVVHIL